MSTLCNGEVLLEGHVWSCLACGCIGTSWSRQHQPMLTKAVLFLASLREVAIEASKPQNVEAAQSAL
jgi:hypothetical protein